MVNISLSFGGAMVLLGAAAITASAGSASEERHAPVASANIAVTATEMQPTPLPVTGGRVIRRSADGLFYVEGQANGQSIRFVVDTGATVVVLNRTDAEKLGIAFEALAGKASMRTVGGSSDMRWAKIDRIDMAGKRIEKINAAVVDGGLPVSLMGQNALEQLGTVTLRGDTMIIH